LISGGADFVSGSSIFDRKLRVESGSINEEKLEPRRLPPSRGGMAFILRLPDCGEEKVEKTGPGDVMCLGSIAGFEVGEDCLPTEVPLKLNRRLYYNETRFSYLWRNWSTFNLSPRESEPNACSAASARSEVLAEEFPALKCLFRTYLVN
jgi:hypothetical protein